MERGHHHERARALRVALVFGGAVIREHTLRNQAAVGLGDGPGVTLPLPDGVVAAPSLPFMQPTDDGGYEVMLHPAMGGAIWTARGRQAVSSIARDRIKVGPTDYGVVTVGPAAIFFQRVDRGPAMRRPFGFDPDALASLGLSTFLHLAALFLLFLAQRESPRRDDGALPADLVRRFLVTRPAEPEPVTPADIASAADERTAEEGCGPRCDAAEAASPEPEVARPRVARQRMSPSPFEGSEGDVLDRGLLRAIGGRDGRPSAIAEAMEVASIGDILAGRGDGPAHGGPGRVGLRGIGPAERGGGPGLGPVGPLDTNVGDDQVRERITRADPERVREHRIELPPPHVEGDDGYPSAAVQRVVMRNRGAVRACFESELARRSSLEGRVEVSWRIGADGRVASARVARSSVHSASVEGCILRQVRAWRFERPALPVEVVYPFVFHQVDAR